MSESYYYHLSAPFIGAGHQHELMLVTIDGCHVLIACYFDAADGD